MNRSPKEILLGWPPAWVRAGLPTQFPPLWYAFVDESDGTPHCVLIAETQEAAETAAESYAEELGGDAYANAAMPLAEHNARAIHDIMSEVHGREWHERIYYPERRYNPSPAKHYRKFHGTDPSDILEGRVWIPGGMVCMGESTVVRYVILAEESKKEKGVLYVHNFGAGVKCYRKPKSGEAIDRSWRSFPQEWMTLGGCDGFIYVDDEGNKREIKGKQGLYLAVSPNKKTLIAADSSGVVFLFEGGKMRVTDWIRD